MLILYLKIPCGINQIWCYQIHLVMPRSPWFPDGQVTDAGSDLIGFMADASRFVTTFKDPISPHIYLTALPFSPVESKVSQYFHHQFPHTIVIKVGRASYWPACTLRLDDPGSSVTFVAFSPDGNLIAAGSHNQTIIVWDAETGDILSGPFEGIPDPSPSHFFQTANRLFQVPWTK